MDNLLLCSVLLILLAAAIQDGRTRQISNGWCIILISAGIALHGSYHLFWPLISMLVVGAFLLLYSMFLPNAMGGGDIKFCAACAFVSGTAPVLLSIAGACITMLIFHCFKRQSSYPMMPFFVPFISTYFILERMM